MILIKVSNYFLYLNNNYFISYYNFRGLFDKEGRRKKSIEGKERIGSTEGRKRGNWSKILNSQESQRKVLFCLFI